MNGWRVATSRSWSGLRGVSIAAGWRCRCSSNVWCRTQRSPPMTQISLNRSLSRRRESQPRADPSTLAVIGGAHSLPGSSGAPQFLVRIEQVIFHANGQQVDVGQHDRDPERAADCPAPCCPG